MTNNEWMILTQNRKLDGLMIQDRRESKLKMAELNWKINFSRAFLKLLGNHD